MHTACRNVNFATQTRTWDFHDLFGKTRDGFILEWLVGSGGWVVLGGWMMVGGGVGGEA
jgi:hypothetical protein